jgi:hypothetical protein
MTTAVFTGQFLSPLISQPLGVDRGLDITYRVASVSMLVLVSLPCLLVLLARSKAAAVAVSGKKLD